MTAPKPPQDDNFIAWGIKESQAAALRVRNVHLSYHLAGVIGAILLTIGGLKAWEWHERKLARLEAAASVEKTKATNEHALGEAWKARAVELTDSVKHDTVRVRWILTHTKVDTLLVPAEPVVQDGVTYSDGPPLIPMAVVSKLDFDSLGAACERTQHDCASALAAKDSVIAHQDSQAVALAALNANTAKQLGMQKRSALLSKIVWGVAGIVIGRASAIH